MTISIDDAMICRFQDPSSAVTGLPKTFNLSLSYEDRFEAYVYDILGNATVDQVHRLFKVGKGWGRGKRMSEAVMTG